jgi:L-threonylcarbamoyladenylate synthase
LNDYLLSSDLVIDGGDSKIGIESTIIDCSSEGPKILRPGAVTLDEINAIINLKISNFNSRNETKFSGSFDSHYSPKAKVFLNIEPKPGDGYIALNKTDTPKGVVRLSSPKNNNEFATQLYASFRHGDELNLSRIVVLAPDEIGIGVAINDRLRKASEKH